MSARAVSSGGPHASAYRCAGVDRARVALIAISHVVDDIYQGAVPALLPFFVADRHYSYAAATV
jgi:hypothetical protein